jgi:hypothetical protein
MTGLAALALAACFAVPPSSDRITVRDLATHVAGLESAPPDRQLSLAPAPGVKRIFNIAELRRAGANADHDLCFERPVSVLTAESVLEAMHRQLPNARIELIETSRAPVPGGGLEFPLSGLHSTAPGAMLWSGYVLYGGKQRFYVWARVRIPNDINRGDIVQVEVRSGAAVLELDAQAQTSGVAGQTVSLLNPVSKKRFQAKIQGPGKAVVGKIE